MCGIKRALLASIVGLLAVATVVAAAPEARAASSLAGSMQSLIPAPHVYAGGGVVGFGAPALSRPIAGPMHSVVVAQVVNPAAPLADEGYWLASADGGVVAVGNASTHGSLGALHLQAPIVAMAATPDGEGYWLVALDGGVFSFGTAAFHGSTGAMRLNQPIVAMAATPDGGGYWLVASDGGVFAFGDAPFLGSMGGTALNDPITGMAVMPDDGGYYLVATDGGVFIEGDAVFRGSLGGGLGGNPRVVLPVSDITLTQHGTGYWLLDPDGFPYDFTNTPIPAPSSTAAAIISVATSQVNADPVEGYFCNPYGPCEAWCALFATWVWRQAGVPIPSYGFTGDIYGWAATNTAVLPPTAMALPGDAVLYGTGPQNPDTSEHVGLVMQVWPDGAVLTVEGDAGPAPVGSLGVVTNGPYLPGHSAQYNGMPVYALARP